VPSSRAPRPAARRGKSPAGEVAPPAPPPRIARRERRRERSREEIVAAARAVLLRDGIAATTLEAVAREVGVTKAALYYYYPSKDALLFDVMFGLMEGQAQAIHDAVEQTDGGAAALRAIIRETFATFAARLDDFRLVFLHGPVAGPGAVHLAAQHFARIRPLNDLAYAGAARRLAAERKRRRPRAAVDPRLMAFLANLAAVGVLTFKGMVESVGDPLRYSDDELVEGLARIFEAAARA
jgi:AcrR family transcriptional regulator